MDLHDGIPVCLPAGGALELFQKLLGQQASNGLSNLYMVAGLSAAVVRV